MGRKGLLVIRFSRWEGHATGACFAHLSWAVQRLELLPIATCMTGRVRFGRGNVVVGVGVCCWTTTFAGARSCVGVGCRRRAACLAERDVTSRCLIAMEQGFTPPGDGALLPAHSRAGNKCQR